LKKIYFIIAHLKIRVTYYKMTFNSKKLAKLITDAIKDVDEDDIQETTQKVIDKYMKSVKPTAGKKAKKDPYAPKRPMSAYLFFGQEARPRIKEENPDATFGEIAGLLSAEWKEITEKEKKPYNKKAAAAKAKYEKVKAAYDAKKKVSSDDDSDSEDEDEKPKGKGKKAPAKKVAKGKKAPAKKVAKGKKAPAKKVVESSDDEDSDSDSEEEKPKKKAPVKGKKAPVKKAPAKKAAKGKKVVKKAPAKKVIESSDEDSDSDSE
jgi:non-histone chromosomal protein 6